MPEPLSSEDLEAITRMAAKVVETFGDDWDLHYNADGDEVSCRTDYDNPFEGSYVEIFNTSQWPSGSEDSPVADFLGASIVVIPRLIAEVERRLNLEDVERFLKRERDEYEPRGECWNTVDGVLDCFRLHMVTGTPLTDPRPEEGPGDPSVGSPPLAEAEELRVEVDRLKAANARLVKERDLAVAHDRQPYPTQWAYDQACAALEKHRVRAEAAEAVIRQALAEVEHEEVVYLLNRYLTAREAVTG